MEANNLQKISIIGAGNVGSTCAFSLFTKNALDIVLIDKLTGLAEGRALDIAQSAAIWKTDSKIQGSSGYESLESSKAIVITAGFPRKPGMDRNELLQTNAGIMKEIIDEVKTRAPEAVIIVVSNPVDNLTYFVIKYGAFSPEKVFGMSGTVDTARLLYFASQESSMPINEIEGEVIGPHSDSMIPFVKKIRGQDSVQMIGSDELDSIYKKTKNAGAEIVNLLKTGSAYYTPGSSAALLAEAVINNEELKTESSVYLQGQYGITDVCIGAPVKINGSGISQILEEELSETQVGLLKQAAEQLRQDNRLLPL